MIAEEWKILYKIQSQLHVNKYKPASVSGHKAVHTKYIVHTFLWFVYCRKNILYTNGGYDSNIDHMVKNI